MLEVTVINENTSEPIVIKIRFSRWSHEGLIWIEDETKNDKQCIAKLYYYGRIFTKRTYTLEVAKRSGYCSYCSRDDIEKIREFNLFFEEFNSRIAYVNAGCGVL
jgi:hypothetical protein